MAELTCERMARGGMYDQLAGGFARYSVDARLGGAALREDALRQRAAAAGLRAPGPASPARRSPCAWPTRPPAFLLRDLRTAEGGFASALDADTDGVEGLTYAWTPAQLREVLGAEDGRLGRGAAARSPTRARSSTAPRRCSSRPTRPIPRGGRGCGPRCWPRAPSARSPRATTRWSPPGTAWRSSRWPRPAPRSTGRSGSPPPRGPPTCCWTLHVVDGRLRRSSRDGVVGAAAGVLEDHAALADGLLALHQATGAPRLARGRDATCSTWPSRTSPIRTTPGAFFDTADDAEALLHRPREITDNASPVRRLRAGLGAAHGVGAGRAEAARLPGGGRGGAARRRARCCASTRGSPGTGSPRPRRMVAGPLQVGVAGDRAGAPGLRAARRAPGGTVVVAGRAGRARRAAAGRPAARRRGRGGLRVPRLRVRPPRHHAPTS